MQFKYNTEYENSWECSMPEVALALFMLQMKYCKSTTLYS